MNRFCRFFLDATGGTRSIVGHVKTPSQPPALTISGVLHRGFRLFVDRLGVYVGLAALVTIPCTLIVAWFMTHSVDVAMPVPAWFHIVNWIAMIVPTVVFAATIHVTLEALRGRRATLGESLSVGLRRFFPLVGVSIVYSICFALGFVLLIVPGILIALTLYMAFPIAVNERRGVFGALRRAAALSKGHRQTLFGLALLYFGLCTGGHVAVMLPFGLASFVAERLAGPDVSLALLIAGMGLPYLATTAMHGIVVAVAYHDLRTLKDADAADRLEQAFS